MSKQLKLNAMQEPKSAVSRLSRSEMQAHKKKGNLIGYFDLTKIGRPRKEKASKITKMVNTSEENETKDPLKWPKYSRVDWSSSTNFP